MLVFKRGGRARPTATEVAGVQSDAGHFTSSPHVTAAFETRGARTGAAAESSRRPHQLTVPTRPWASQPHLLRKSVIEYDAPIALFSHQAMMLAVLGW